MNIIMTVIKINIIVQYYKRKRYRIEVGMYGYKLALPVFVSHNYHQNINLCSLLECVENPKSALHVTINFSTSQACKHKWIYVNRDLTLPPLEQEATRKIVMLISR